MAFQHALILMLVCCLPLSVSASFLNAGLETGDLTGWSVVGTAEVSSGIDYPPAVDPFEGDYSAVVIAGDVPLAALAEQLSIDESALADLAEGASQCCGSMISQTVNFAGNQLVTFAWNFFSNEDLPEFVDLAFVGISSAYESRVSLLISSVAVGEITATGWQTHSLYIAQPGEYTLFFGATNGGADAFFPSELWVDSLDVMQLPEPSTAALTMLGLLLWYMFRRLGIGRAKTSDPQGRN